MKRFLSAMLLAVMLASCVSGALAYGPRYEDYYGNDCFVCSELHRGDYYYVYMYSEASDMGSPRATYENGTILRVINWYASSNFAYVIGPDNVAGYVVKTRLVQSPVYESSYLANFDPCRVQSELHRGNYYYMYMYPVASDMGDPCAELANGEIVFVIDWYASKDFCFAITQYGTVGYLLKARLLPLC